MFYRVMIYDKNEREAWGAGVYAQTEQAAREIAVVLIFRSMNYNVRPEDFTVVEVQALQSNVATTT